MIESQNLGKHYGKKNAVWDLNLQIRAGEVFGLLGPNGAGKTTTVRMLTGLIAPSEGSAKVNGFELGKHNTQIRQTVGLLTETTGFYERLSAQKNLEIYANLYNIHFPQKTAEKYLKLMDLWEERDSGVSQFSKGMKQRLAIARALLHDPQTIFLDEPTAGLDPLAAKTVRGYIEKLRELGRTVFLTTHNLDEAERLCDRIAVLKGSVLAMDSPQNLQTNLFGRRVKIQGMGFHDQLVHHLHQIPFVREIKIEDTTTLLVHINDPETNNPELIRWLITHGVYIQYVIPADASLEDVYLDIVSSKTPAN